MGSKFLSISSRDLVHGLFITVGGAVIDSLITVIRNGGFAFTKQDLLNILSVALVAGLTYLSKKFFSDEEGRIAGKI